MMVAYYAGQLVMNTFRISIPGLRIAGADRGAIGFRILFPGAKSAWIAGSDQQIGRAGNRTEREYRRFVPIAMPSTAGPGTIAMIISSASTVRDSATFPRLGADGGTAADFAIIGIIVWASLRSSGHHALGRQGRYRGDFPPDGLLTGLSVWACSL